MFQIYTGSEFADFISDSDFSDFSESEIFRFFSDSDVFRFFRFFRFRQNLKKSESENLSKESDEDSDFQNLKKSEKSESQNYLKNSDSEKI